jgi:hypothetical protein
VGVNIKHSTDYHTINNDGALVDPSSPTPLFWGAHVSKIMVGMISNTSFFCVQLSAGVGRR